MIETIQGQKCIRLQSYGWAPAMQAKDLKVGYENICNFGTIQTITEIERTTPGYIWCTVESKGIIYKNVRFGLSRYIGVTTKTLNQHKLIS